MMISKIAQPVLVTGATGFIGSRVVHKLLQNGVAVKVLALPGEAIPVEWAEKVEIVRGSISDPQAVAKAATGAKTIIHLVAIVTDWGDEKSTGSLPLKAAGRFLKKLSKTKPASCWLPALWFTETKFTASRALKKRLTEKHLAPTAGPSRRRKISPGIIIKKKE